MHYYRTNFIYISTLIYLKNDIYESSIFQKKGILLPYFLCVNYEKIRFRKNLLQK